jgi:hypothetical protein
MVFDDQIRWKPGRLEDWRLPLSSLPASQSSKVLPILNVKIHILTRWLIIDYLFLFALAGLATWLIADTLKHGQERIFAETRIRFGPLTHNKRATFGALDNFSMLAGGTQADKGGDLHTNDHELIVGQTF